MCPILKELCFILCKKLSAYPNNCDRVGVLVEKAATVVSFFFFFQINLSLRQIMVIVPRVSELINDRVRILTWIIKLLLQLP